MARAELSDAARYDLWEIYFYYADQTDLPLADQVRDEILGKIRLLSEHKLIGSPRFELRPGMRAFPHKKFVIFYLPTESGVYILRVIHSAMDIRSMGAADFEN